MRRRLRSLALLAGFFLLLLFLLQLVGFGRQNSTDQIDHPEGLNEMEGPRLVLHKNEESRLVHPKNEGPRLVLPKNEGPRLVLPKNEESRLVPSMNKAPLLDPETSFRVHYKFAFMLQTMGYSAPQPRSAKEKAALDQFFDTVQHFAITQHEREVFVELWRTFDRLCREQSFTYFLFFGTLLGAYRHHGMVPWDDDLDLMLPESEMGPLIVLLKEHPELESAEQSFFVHRVFFRDRRKSLPRFGESWSWPYLELHFYRQTGGRIRQSFNSCPEANVADFFPLVRVPFEGHLAPAPRCMDRIMTECYGAVHERCCTKNFDHRHGQDLHYAACVDCHLLIEIFPFVTNRRHIGEAKFEEKVTLNGSVQAVRRVAKGRGC